MIRNLLISKNNNYGLTRDAVILIKAIEEAGSSVRWRNIGDRGILDRFRRRKIAQRAVHLERAFPQWISSSRENILIPNQERFPVRMTSRLKRIDRVLAKTRHAAAIFADLGVHTDYLGFSSEDRLDAGIAREWSRFFHLGGGSTLKGTWDLVRLWSRHPEWPELVLVQKEKNAPAHLPANVRLISGFVGDKALSTLQNACGVHLCPSRSEGWGHHILEAMSCACVVVTTDAPPMNEHVTGDCGILVPYSRSEPRHLGTSYHVDADALEEAIQRLVDMGDAEKAKIGAKARERYLSIGSDFRERVAQLLAQ